MRFSQPRREALTHLRDGLVQIIVRVEQFQVVLLQRAREATCILFESERDLTVLLRLPDEREPLRFCVRKLLELLFPARTSCQTSLRYLF